MMNFMEKYIITNELTLKRYRRFKRNRAAVLSVFVLLFMIFVSFTAELWINNKPHIMKYHGEVYFPLFKNYHPTVFDRNDIQVMDYRSLEMGSEDWAVWPMIQWDPYESNSAVESYPAPPTRYNLMGTDDRGRDVFTRLVYGFRYTITYAVGVWFLSYLIGCMVGATMGYVGGKVDLVGMRLIEIFESIPSFFILITIISIFKPDMFLLVLFSVVFDWTGISHYMRGQFLSLRKREYVEAAKAIGSTHKRTIFKHILPNALTPILTLSPFAIAGNIYTLQTMDYLGLGLPAPTPSWGELMGQSQSYFTTAEWLVWYPAGALVLTMSLLISINLAIRDAFDAKSSVG
jgi:microcin C transport system permease protein